MFFGLNTGLKRGCLWPLHIESPTPLPHFFPLEALTSKMEMTGMDIWPPSHINILQPCATCLWFLVNGCMVPALSWIQSAEGCHAIDDSLLSLLSVGLNVRNTFWFVFLVMETLFAIAKIQSHWAICKQRFFRRHLVWHFIYDLPDVVGIPFGINVLDGEYETMNFQVRAAFYRYRFFLAELIGKCCTCNSILYFPQCIGE